MTDELNFAEAEEKKLPTGLNVLTILTIIWSAYELFSSFKNFFGAADKLAEFDKAQEKMAGAPEWAKSFAGPQMRELVVQTMNNKIPMMIIALISVGLCVWGAIEMRKLKKQGYILYVIGEILPYISVALFAGAFFKTFLVYFIFFPVLFILLYTFQRKHLVN